MNWGAIAGGFAQGFNQAQMNHRANEELELRKQEAADAHTTAQLQQTQLSNQNDSYAKMQAALKAAGSSGYDLAAGADPSKLIPSDQYMASQAPPAPTGPSAAMPGVTAMPQGAMPQGATPAPQISAGTPSPPPAPPMPQGAMPAAQPAPAPPPPVSGTPTPSSAAAPAPTAAPPAAPKESMVPVSYNGQTYYAPASMAKKADTSDILTRIGTALVSVPGQTQTGAALLVSATQLKTDNLKLLAEQRKEALTQFKTQAAMGHGAQALQTLDSQWNSEPGTVSQIQHTLNPDGSISQQTLMGGQPMGPPQPLYGGKSTVDVGGQQVPAIQAMIMDLDAASTPEGVLNKYKAQADMAATVARSAYEKAETNRINTLLPGEVNIQHAQAGALGAQAGEARARSAALGAETQYNYGTKGGMPQKRFNELEDQLNAEGDKVRQSILSMDPSPAGVTRANQAAQQAIASRLGNMPTPFQTQFMSDNPNLVPNPALSGAKRPAGGLPATRGVARPAARASAGGPRIINDTAPGMAGQAIGGALGAAGRFVGSGMQRQADANWNSGADSYGSAYAQFKQQMGSGAVSQKLINELKGVVDDPAYAGKFSPQDSAFIKSH